MENKTITLIKEDGTESLAEIVFTYFSEEYNKNYIVLKIIDEDLLTAAIYEPTDGEDGKLTNIESEEEWELIESLLDDYFQEHDLDCDCGCEGDCDCEDCDHEDSDEECQGECSHSKCHHDKNQ